MDTSPLRLVSRLEPVGTHSAEMADRPASRAIAMKCSQTVQPQEPGVLLRSLLYRLLRPIVVTARGDLEYATHRLNAIFASMALDELLVERRALARRVLARPAPRRGTIPA